MASARQFFQGLRRVWGAVQWIGTGLSGFGEHATGAVEQPWRIVRGWVRRQPVLVFATRVGALGAGAYGLAAITGSGWLVAAAGMPPGAEWLVNAVFVSWGAGVALVFFRLRGWWWVRFVRAGVLIALLGVGPAIVLSALLQGWYGFDIVSRADWHALTEGFLAGRSFQWSALGVFAGGFGAWWLGIVAAIVFGERLARWLNPLVGVPFRFALRAAPLGLFLVGLSFALAEGPGALWGAVRAASDPLVRVLVDPRTLVAAPIDVLLVASVVFALVGFELIAIGFVILARIFEAMARAVGRVLYGSYGRDAQGRIVIEEGLVERRRRQPEIRVSGRAIVVASKGAPAREEGTPSQDEPGARGEWNEAPVGEQDEAPVEEHGEAPRSERAPAPAPSVRALVAAAKEPVAVTREEPRPAPARPPDGVEVRGRLDEIERREAARAEEAEAEARRLEEYFGGEEGYRKVGQIEAGEIGREFFAERVLGPDDAPFGEDDEPLERLYRVGPDAPLSGYPGADPEPFRLIGASPGVAVDWEAEQARYAQVGEPQAVPSVLATSHAWAPDDEEGIGEAPTPALAFVAVDGVPGGERGAADPSLAPGDRVGFAGEQGALAFDADRAVLADAECAAEDLYLFGVGGRTWESLAPFVERLIGCLSHARFASAFGRAQELSSDLVFIRRLVAAGGIDPGALHRAAADLEAFVRMKRRTLAEALEAHVASCAPHEREKLAPWCVPGALGIDRSEETPAAR